MNIKRDMKAQKKIADFLLDKAGEKMYLSQIAKNSGTSISTCHQVLERLTKEDFTLKDKIGNLSQFHLDLNDPLTRQRKVTRTIELLKPLVERLKEFSQKIILFGSAAEGSDTGESDVDLFILTNEKDEARKIILKAKIGKKIQAIIKDSLEFSELREKDKYFYEEIKRGKVLWEADGE